MFPATQIRSRLIPVFSRIFELSADRGPGRMLGMEGLRGVAILLVFFCHYYDIVWSNLTHSTVIAHCGEVVLTIGGTGVDLFFVLSGFLIYRAVMKARFRFGSFIARRAKRIYPAFLAMFGVYLLLVLLGHAFPNNSSFVAYSSRIPSGRLQALTYLFANLIFLPGVTTIKPLMNVAWSLSYECTFYLLLPVFVITTRFIKLPSSYRMLMILGAAVAFVSLFLMFPSVMYVPFAPGRNSHVRAITFFGGMLVAEVATHKEWVHSHGAWLDRAPSVAFGIIAAIGVFSWFALDGRVGLTLVRAESFEAAALFIAYSLLVLSAVRPRENSKSILESHPLRWLGNMSYSFYLAHGLALHILGMLVARVFPNNLSATYLLVAMIAMLPVSFIATSAVSTILFMFVEKKYSLSGGDSRPREHSPFKTYIPVSSVSSDVNASLEMSSQPSLPLTGTNRTT